MNSKISRRIFLKFSGIAAAISSTFLTLSCEGNKKSIPSVEKSTSGDGLVRLADSVGPVLFPMPVVLCGAIVNGKPNFNLLGNFGILNANPFKPFIYISSNESHYTNIGIKEHQEFSVCFPHANILARADYCGMYSGHKVDKSSVFKTQFGTLKFAPLIEDMNVGFACKVIQQHSINKMEVFFGEIIEKFASSSCLVNGKPDPDKISPIVYAPGDRYYSVKDIIGKPWSEYNKYNPKSSPLNRG